MTELLDHGVHMWLQGPDAIQTVVLGNGPLFCRMLLVIGLTEEVVHDILPYNDGTCMVILSIPRLVTGFVLAVSQ